EMESLDTKLRPDELGAALARGLASRNRPFCLAFDALDEAALPNEMWRDFLRPLGEPINVRLLIGARPLFDWGTATVVDLTHRTYLGENDVRNYVERRLLAVEEPDRRTPYRDKAGLAQQVAKAAAMRADGVFLVARIVSRLLIDANACVDTSVAGWEQQIP